MAAAAAAGGEVVEFGWEDADKKPLSGRRKKALQEQKKKNKSGTFESMGLAPWLLKSIRRKGYRLPTPIQRRTIPLILQGSDVIGMARTGSGKTAAFVIPLLQKLAAHAPKAGARGLILSPTRELALQTHKVVRELSKGTTLRTAVLVGGDAMEAQFAELAQNPDIIVATPGRLLHHLAEVSGFSLAGVEYCVFDEADRMFEMGFAEQVREIVGQLRESRQTLMFSATLPRSLADFAAAGLSSPQLVRLDADRKLSPDLGLAFFTVRADQKPAALLWLVREALPQGSSTLVFASTRHHVEFLHNMLAHEGVPAACVFGSMDQTARKIHVAKFRAGRVGVLITTDVAARGIDIPLIDNVINYDFPAKPELFVHRCGRAARAGRSGGALCLLTREELPYLLDLHLYLGRQVAPAPETPQPQQVAAAAEAAAGSGGLVAAAAADPSGPSQYGHFPSLLLDPLIEHLRQLVEAQQDLGGMTRSLSNAYALYLKTRPSASSESVKRAKQLAAEGAHPLLLATMQQQGAGRVDLQHEASLAEFTAKLRAFRPAATVLEAEIAKVRPSHAGPTMQTEAEAALRYKSNDIMSKKRSAHAHIIEKERQKRRLAAAAAGQHQQLGELQDAEQQQAPPRKKQKQQQQQQQQQQNGGSELADGDSDELQGGSDSEGGSDGDAGLQHDELDSDGPQYDDYGEGELDMEEAEQQQQQQRGGSSSGTGSKRAAVFVLSDVIDGPLAAGKYKDDGLYISNTRDGRTHAETFEFDNEAAQLQSAVLDLTGEDQDAMTAQRRQFKWDKKKKAYVNTAGTEDKRGLKLKKVMTESGQMVLAGPGKDGRTGELYKKWAKHNKARVVATGAPEAAAPDPDLARRFDKGMRHKSFKVKGAAPVKGGELKSKAQVARERAKKAQLQQGMKERADANAARREGKPSGRAFRGKGRGGGFQGANSSRGGFGGGVKGGGVRNREGGGGGRGGRGGGFQGANSGRGGFGGGVGKRGGGGGGRGGRGGSGFQGAKGGKGGFGGGVKGGGVGKREGGGGGRGGRGGKGGRR